MWSICVCEMKNKAVMEIELIYERPKYRFIIIFSQYDKLISCFHFSTFIAAKAAVKHIWLDKNHMNTEHWTWIYSIGLHVSLYIYCMFNAPELLSVLLVLLLFLLCLMFRAHFQKLWHELKRVKTKWFRLIKNY